MKFTIVWEIIGGDVMVSRLTIDATPETLTESQLLLALGENEESAFDPSDVAILATFPGHAQNCFGAAINDE